jgi:hypothetical protein
MTQQINQDDIAVKFIKKKHSSKDLQKIPCSGDKRKPCFRGIAGKGCCCELRESFLNGEEATAPAGSFIFCKIIN